MEQKITEKQEIFLASFRELEKKLAGKEPAWLSRIRREAIERFAAIGFPTTRDEEWKFTSVAPLAKISFSPAAQESLAGFSKDLAQEWLGEGLGNRLVFVNGRYSESMSSVENFPRGVLMGSLAAALQQANGQLEAHLARYAVYRNHAFAALNTALWEDGAYLRIPKGTVVEEPVHVLYVSTAGKQASVSHPRTLLVAEPDSQVTLIESYVGLPEGVCFSNAVTEIVAGENSVIDHYKLQKENGQSYHIAVLQVHQERNAHVSSCSISLDGALVRNDVNVTLDAEGAECVLNGLYMAGGRQHVDNHTTVDHAKPHGTSRQLYKGILSGHAAGVFNGKILVRKDAQKTNAVQYNKNLLLSENAAVNTKPQLEILADDVRCTHGATVGQIDPEAVFYLRSRGIGQQDAQSLLTYAFAGEVIERIRPEPVRTQVQTALFARLSATTSLTTSLTPPRTTSLQEAV
ncbi:MAG: Fe-S cluster assembly protein SufD [Acidobacteria bacterium]|nr:Fe-S cluster assembly protein SufD [Acidobacteriota bacterium]